MARQLGFKELKAPSRKFGGDLLKNSHAKTRRPLDSKLPIHLVLRSNKSVMKLPKHLGRIHECIDLVNRRHGVVLYRMANVGNHLHMVIKIPSRRAWAAFIRELTGRIASIAGIRGEKFWAKLPFTHLVGGWKKAYRSVMDYVELNQWEAEGFISRKDIRTRKDLETIWGSSA